MLRRGFGFWLWGALASALGCSGGDASVETGCVAASAPTAELGIGAETFAAVTDGQDVRLERGSQGGCHVSLAVQTGGFPGRRVTVDYTITRLDNDERVLRSRSVARLVGEGQTCEAAGIRAILMMPWDVEDVAVRIDATMVDELEREVEGGFEAVLRWPASEAGIEDRLLCGDPG